MAKPLTNEKRADIIRHKQNNEDNKDIARWLFVCVRTVERVIKRYEKTGSSDALPQNSGRKPLVSSETMERIVDRIKEIPDITLAEIIEEFSLSITESALSKRLKTLGLTYKKRRYIQMGKNAKMLSRQEKNGEKNKRK